LGIDLDDKGSDYSADMSEFHTVRRSDDATVKSSNVQSEFSGGSSRADIDGFTGDHVRFASPSDAKVEGCGMRSDVAAGHGSEDDYEHFAS
jgi:hypothetical protein